MDSARRATRPSPGRRRARRPAELLPALGAVVDYRPGSGPGWTATLSSPHARFPSRSVQAPDAEGIFLAVLMALDALRVETGYRIESEHVVHDGFTPPLVAGLGPA